MGKHFEKRARINFGNVNKARKVKSQNKVRKSSREKGDIEQKG